MCLIYFTTGQERPTAGLSWNCKVEIPGIRKLSDLWNSKLIPLIPKLVFIHLWIAAKSTVTFSHHASVYKIIMWPSSRLLLQFLSALSCVACFAVSWDVKGAKPGKVAALFALLSTLSEGPIIPAQKWPKSLSRSLYPHNQRKLLTVPLCTQGALCLVCLPFRI